MSGFNSTDTIYTSIKEYPDSNTATIQYYWMNSLEPTYNYKETHLKSTGLVTINDGYNKDSIYLSTQKNNFHPLIWDMFELDYVYANYAPYKSKSLLLSQFHNTYFVDRKVSNGSEQKSVYKYDSKGRATNISVEYFETDNAANTGSPLQPRFGTYISIQY